MSYLSPKFLVPFWAVGAIAAGLVARTGSLVAMIAWLVVEVVALRCLVALFERTVRDVQRGCDDRLRAHRERLTPVYRATTHHCTDDD